MKHKTNTTVNRYIYASVAFMGMGHMLLGYWLKGLTFILVELFFLINIPYMIDKIYGLITLGDTVPIIDGFTIIPGDNSLTMLISGSQILLIIGIFALCYYATVIDLKRVLQDISKTELYVGKDFRSQLIDFYESNFVFLMLFPVLLLIAFFILLPIFVTFLVAFTNYSAPNYVPPKNLFDWVGFKSFSLFIFDETWRHTIKSLFIWTVIWAFAATFTCYIAGLLMALMTNVKKLRLKHMWSTVLILPYAVPPFVSLLIMSIIFSGIGPVNGFLYENFGLDRIPFFYDVTLARLMMILVNMWIGAPYFMMLISSSLTNVSESLYEAAIIDGANRVQQFFYITLPMILMQTAPMIIFTLIFNFNNFGAVYLLTGGGPRSSDLKFAGSTDLIVSWLYSLTLKNQQYNIAAVVSILLFIILGLFGYFTLSRTKIFSEE